MARRARPAKVVMVAAVCCLAGSLPLAAGAAVAAPAYEVVNPIEVQIGVARPWYGYIGGGFQIYFPYSIANLLKMGHIRVVP